MPPPQVIQVTRLGSVTRMELLVLQLRTGSPMPALMQAVTHQGVVFEVMGFLDFGDHEGAHVIARVKNEVREPRT